MSSTFQPIDELCINTIRTLSIDAVQKANSGHPGMPLGAAQMAYVLWTRHLRHNPTNPKWPDRDRFVLSAGHASMLLYSLLFLTGYDLTMADIQQFRQWGSRTPGHPEYGVVPGAEVTTGPLGQGVGNAVGFAIAERWLAATFNRSGHEVVNHYTYVMASDGDMMEGVAAEAASIAGQFRLGRLIVLYDSNKTTLSASTDVTFSEDVGARFQAYGWHVEHVDGHDTAAVDAALTKAKAIDDRPSLIVARTHIGYGSPHNRGGVEDRGCAHLGAGRTCAYAPEITYSGPLNAGVGFGSGERSVCPQRLCYGFADRYPDRYRFRSVGCAGSAQPTDARRNCKPGRLDAVVGFVSVATAILQGHGSSSRRQGASQHRGRLPDRMGALRGPRRHNHRSGSLRWVGTR
jgi:transketolase N-terminal domain/subunit